MQHLGTRFSVLRASLGHNATCSLKIVTEAHASPSLKPGNTKAVFLILVLLLPFKQTFQTLFSQIISIPIAYTDIYYAFIHVLSVYTYLYLDLSVDDR